MLRTFECILVHIIINVIVIELKFHPPNSLYLIARSFQLLPTYFDLRSNLERLIYCAAYASVKNSTFCLGGLTQPMMSSKP